MVRLFQYAQGKQITEGSYIHVQEPYSIYSSSKTI
jgi:hypothetical protein